MSRIHARTRQRQGNVNYEMFTGGVTRDETSRFWCIPEPAGYFFSRTGALIFIPRALLDKRKLLLASYLVFPPCVSFLFSPSLSQQSAFLSSSLTHDYKKYPHCPIFTPQLSAKWASGCYDVIFNDRMHP
ncbi:hypothetical protein M413DRAFT_119705 [Hebeloma cylindrosporum]|uniref:Uncharacterized protein n=1 Tax=Hebeloma cylindrosporum TaxID=76867 RepID=A0A0C3C0X8_HEBCY|nr:hypothetical protein M413DRAFT_119705 [Hebeloma cylindrosporum h7]